MSAQSLPRECIDSRRPTSLTNINLREPQNTLFGAYLYSPSLGPAVHNCFLITVFSNSVGLHVFVVNLLHGGGEKKSIKHLQHMNSRTLKEYRFPSTDSLLRVYA